MTVGGVVAVADACTRAVARHDVEVVLWMSWLVGFGGLLITVGAVVGLPVALVVAQRRGRA